VYFGWQGVFLALAAVSALAALGAGYLYFLGAQAAAAKTLPMSDDCIVSASGRYRPLGIEWPTDGERIASHGCAQSARGPRPPQRQRSSYSGFAGESPAFGRSGPQRRR